jgi:opacity protein-like surface antigen
VYGGAGYQLSSSWSAFAGYRYLSVDYNKDGFVYDIDQHGPMLGAIYRF